MRLNGFAILAKDILNTFYIEDKLFAKYIYINVYTQ